MFRTKKQQEFLIYIKDAYFSQCPKTKSFSRKKIEIAEYKLEMRVESIKLAGEE